MKKKIIAFFMAFNISVFTSILCYAQPVFATSPAIDYSLLMDAISTLYFMTGLQLPDGVNAFSNDKDRFDWMDSEVRAEFEKANTEKAQELNQAFDEFIDSVKRGYGIAFNLNNDLYEYMQVSAYTGVIAPNIVYKDAPLQMQNWLAGQTGNIILVANAQGGLAPDKKKYQFFNVGSYTPLETPILLTSHAYGNSPTGYEYQWQLTTSYSSNIRYTFCHMGNDENTFGTATIDYLSSAQVWTNYNPIEYAYILNHTNSYAFSTDALINDYITQGQYTDIIDNTYGVDTDGNVIIDSTGDLPNVIGRDTTNDLITDITDGATTWGDVIGSFATSEPANPSIPADGSLTLPQLDNLISGLDLDRLETKFPFCIPNDLMLIINGATAVSSNAPVVEIPLRIEFNGKVYYDNDKAVVIDFNDFSNVVTIFREGFFLLFLIALLWVSIDILQAFFVVTE